MQRSIAAEEGGDRLCALLERIELNPHAASPARCRLGSMKILVGAFGTRGDVQPMLALAQTLLARGHSVSLAVPPNSVLLARAFGLEASGVGLDYEEISRRAVNGSFREFAAALPLVRGQVDAQLHALEERAAGADLIVGSSVFTVGTLLADKLGKPYVFFAFCPQLFPSGDHPNPLVRRQTLPRWANRMSWVTFHWLWKAVLLSTLNRAREARGLSRVREVWSSLMGRTPVVACDPALASAPSDHRIPVAQVGALFAEEKADLSEEVRAFIEAGEPPVYVGFGSMSDRDPARTTERLLESIRRAGVRALVSRGWAGLSSTSSPGGVLLIGPEPHGKLFSRCAAVVHHGGAGTTHAAARAGVPQVIMPQLLDQHYWAHRVHRAGIGPRSVPRYATDPWLLARALRRCVDDVPMRERALRVAARMRTTGTSEAADLLERIGDRPSTRAELHPAA
jgi:vancomycin aglycone glucosyltransferase